jgi:amphi-Trp domain-containing protein
MMTTIARAPQTEPPPRLTAAETSPDKPDCLACGNAARRSTGLVHYIRPNKGARGMAGERDIEKTYPVGEFIEKLRRLADALETGERFDIQIAGERIFVPARARYNIEHERSKDGEEIEFQIKWEKE